MDNDLQRYHIGLVFFRAYVLLYKILAAGVRINLPGLGFFLRCFHKPFIFEVKGRSFVFNPLCASSYCLLPAGVWNEPETHLFLHSVISKMSETVCFVDVGASVGEFVVDMACTKGVSRVIAFEPQAEELSAVEKSLRVNNSTIASMVKNIVLDRRGNANLMTESGKRTAARVGPSSAGEANPVPCTTLDHELGEFQGAMIILMDVEGSELLVIKGAGQVINRLKPLIIFEYNEVTRRHCSLQDISKVLGDDYIIYNLKQNGRLDKNLAETWNCVAVCRTSRFWEICTLLVS